MKLFISVVSHNHSKIINDLNCLAALSDRIQVIVKSNTPNDDFSELSARDNVHWINSHYGLGFGANNNFVHSYILENLNMNDDDYFLVLNPDVFVDECSLLKLISRMSEDNLVLSTINLYKDDSMTVSDDSIRRFPTFLQFFRSFLGGGNTSIIDKSELAEPSRVDWAAGSFLCFSSGHYKKLSGFDENYYMYCEDIDICYRSYLLGNPVVYMPDLKAVHFAAHANRNLFSKHFYWHVKSALRFLLLKNLS